MKLSRTIFTSLVLLLSCSAALVAQNPVGIYSKNKCPYYFDIRADGTYRYEYRVDTFIDQVSEGTWELKDKKTILLNSDEDTTLPVEYEIIPTPGSHRDRHLYIELESDNFNEDDFFVIPVNKRVTVPDYAAATRGSQTITTAFLVDSMKFKIKKDPVDNPRPKGKQYFIKQAAPPTYAILETDMIKLMLHPGQSAKIKIYLYDDDFGYRMFKNTPLKLEGKGIKFKDEDENFTYELERQK